MDITTLTMRSSYDYTKEGDARMRGNANLRLPSYVPDGYSLWTVIQGVDAGGFGFINSADQYSVTYFRGQMPDDKGNALTVFKGPPGAKTLAATDARAGEGVKLGMAGVTAVYHDGMWFLGPGVEERTVGSLILHWDRTSFHSLTVRTPADIWGIRGPKGANIDKRQLLQIAASLID